MAAAEKNRLNAISLGLVFYGILRREMHSSRMSSYKNCNHSFARRVFHRVAQEIGGLILMRGNCDIQSGVSMDIF